MATTAQLALGEDVIAAYRRDGAVLVKELLSPGEIDLLTRGLEEINAEPGELYSLVESDDGGGRTMAGQYPSLGSPLLRRLIEQGPGAELAARLMGTPSAQLILDQVFYKDP